VSPTLSNELGKLVDQWSPYINTWRNDFSLLPPFLSDVELENIKGTSFSRYIARVQKEIIKIWDFVLKPTLVKKGIRVNRDKTDLYNGVTGVKGLPTLY